MLQKQTRRSKLEIFECSANIGMGITLMAVKLSLQSVEYVLLASKRIGNPLVFVVGSLGGCLMIYSLAKIIDHFFRIRKCCLT